MGLSGDVEFYEADLAYYICAFLKEFIEKAGGTVMITREYGSSSLGKSFDKWYIEDFKTDLQNSFNKGDVSTELHEILKNPVTEKRFVFEIFYK
ncbi:MAG: hypothetical protein ACKO96_16610, partial [Flammeovirgaceae bacterium]